MIRVLEIDYACICRQLLFLLVDEHPKSNVGHGMAWAGNLLDCRPYQCSLNLVVPALVHPYLLFNLDHQLTYDLGKNLTLYVTMYVG